MKVFVMTRAVPFGVEEFVDVKRTKKEAEKAFRNIHPHMRSSMNDNCFVSDKNNTYILFIREKEV